MGADIGVIFAFFGQY